MSAALTYIVPSDGVVADYDGLFIVVALYTSRVRQFSVLLTDLEVNHPAAELLRGGPHHLGVVASPVVEPDGVNEYLLV